MRALIKTYISKILLMAVTFLVNVTIARYLGPDGVGLYASTMAMGLLLSSVLSLGLEHALIYYTSTNQNQQKKIIQISFAFSLTVITIAGITAAILHSQNIHPINKSAYIIIAMAATMIQSFVVAINIGMGRLHYINAGLIASNLLLLITILTIARYYTLTHTQAILIYAITCIIFSASFSAPCLKKALKGTARNPININELISYSYRSYIGGLAGTVRLRLPIIILPLFLTASEVGIYSIAQTLTEFFYFIPITIASLLIPQITSKSTAEGATIAARYAKLSLALTASSVAIFNLISGELIYFAYGDKFQSAEEIIRILSLAAIIYSTTKIFSSYFMGTGIPEINSMIEILILLLCAALLLVLVPRYGAIGAAYSVLASSTANLIISTATFKLINKQDTWRIIIPTHSKLKIITEKIRGRTK